MPGTGLTGQQPEIYVASAPENAQQTRPMSENMSPALIFLAFAAATFAVLRAVLANFAEDKRATFAAPVLVVFGVGSAFLFNRLALHQYFIWHLLIFTLIVFGWHAKSRVESASVAALLKEKSKADPQAEQNYAMTRRLLSFGLVSYLCAFAAVYYYLYSQTP
jgi:uncharacterized membrane protein